MVQKNYFPPKNWQDFETLIKDLSIEKFNSSFDLFGRRGQSQNGIDIIGTHNGLTIGIQCKHKLISRATSNSFITELEAKTIEDEINKVSSFASGLDKLIIATTSFRDVHIQKLLLQINMTQASKSRFSIEIWFWETIEEEIDSNLNLLKKYYENIVPNFDLDFKEKHILTTIRNAFFRPAFITPFKAENNGNDFIKAIKDVQELLSIGKLKTRNDYYIAGSFSYRNLSSKKDKEMFEEIYQKLQHLRDYTTLKIKESKIKNCNENCFCVSDPEVENKLDILRRNILIQLNEILTRNGNEIIPIRL
jgi:hypothetical protein